MWPDSSETQDLLKRAGSGDPSAINALLETPPLHAGFDPLKPAIRRAYRSKRELEAALARLDEIAETVR